MPVNPELLVGTWRLVRWLRIEGDRRTDRLGPGSVGIINYTADGFMFAQLSAKTRASFAGTDPFGGSAEECRSAMATAISYCGRWRLDTDKIIHIVEQSMFPNWVGTEVVRHVRFEEDHIVLTAPPIMSKGVLGTAELTWRRA